MVHTGNAARVLWDPTNFLHAIDVEGDRAYFVRTNAELLRTASFVDGRVPMATSEPFELPLSELVASAPELGTATDRFVFNCSFCGSTLLGRLLDVPGRSLVLKEPRCLTDIAAWKSLNTRDGLRFVDAPEVARITERRVTLSITAHEAQTCLLYTSPSPRD